ncbi:hypothetical protein [uncultured Salinicola sp.]|uniref:hypothetical protein n=1 Tax=uncultured Salinicola sp. TaxID=1193542 RepID=UPI002616CCB5|nr:hypothetical protein [uncultured Salinicola sp.]
MPWPAATGRSPRPNEKRRRPAIFSRIRTFPISIRHHSECRNPIGRRPINKEAPDPANTRIGILAAHELRRLVATHPLEACKVLSKAEKFFQQKVYQVHDYSRDATGAYGNTDFATGTSYLFTNSDGTLIVHVTPPGPIRFSEDEAWFEHRTLPASVLDTIREEAPGTMLSRYITVDGFDIDLLAPDGIEEVDTMDLLNPGGDIPKKGLIPLHQDIHTILRYPIQSIPFPAFAHEIRMQAVSVIGEEVHSHQGGETDGDDQTP